jgi:hypothetical protein
VADLDELLEVLERWQGSQVSVRVVARYDELLAVFSGRLGVRSDDKAPALFWPIDGGSAPPAEEPGIYLHPDLYEGARVHEGDFVAEYRQAGVSVNLRRY